MSFWFAPHPHARETEIPALIAGRMPELNNDVSKKIWPSVIEITLVGTKADTSPACVSIMGNAVSEPVLTLHLAFGELLNVLGIDTRRAQASGCANKHVARKRLAPRWATQQQRHLTVGHRLLGQVVVDDESVLPRSRKYSPMVLSGGRRPRTAWPPTQRPKPPPRWCTPWRRPAQGRAPRF